MDQERFDVGKEARGRVLGEEYVTRAFANADSFNLEFQQLVTEYCWGEIWGRSVLTDKQRSLNNLCILAALNRGEEFKTALPGCDPQRVHAGRAARHAAADRGLRGHPRRRRGVPARPRGARRRRHHPPDPAARANDRRRVHRPRQHGPADGDEHRRGRLRAGLLRRRRHRRTPAGRRGRGGER